MAVLCAISFSKDQWYHRQGLRVKYRFPHSRFVPEVDKAIHSLSEVSINMEASKWYSRREQCGVLQ